MHQMGARTSPEHDVRSPEVLWHVLSLEHRAVGNVSGDARLAVVHELLAHARPHAVTSDERASARDLAAGKPDRDAFAVVVEILDLLVRFQRDQIACLARLQKYGVNVRAMADRIGLVELRREPLVKWNADHEIARQRIAHFLSSGPPRVGKNGVLQADTFERAEDVGSELNTGADLAEFVRLLEHTTGKALERKRIGRDQPADAATGNEERRTRAVQFGHIDTPASGPIPTFASLFGWLQCEC